MHSTCDFRNAFLKTIRQIIRESVRNMSIPVKGLGSMSSVNSISAYSGGGGNSQTLERPKPTVSVTVHRDVGETDPLTTAILPQVNIMQGSQTLGKTKKSKTGQRHSAGNIDYDNMGGSVDYEDGVSGGGGACPSQPTTTTFRSRSKTVGDSCGK